MLNIDFLKEKVNRNQIEKYFQKEVKKVKILKRSANMLK